MHRQGQSAPALRLRGQGFRRHHAGAGLRWSVRHAFEGAAGTSYDDYTLETVIPDTEAPIGNIIERLAPPSSG